MARYEPVGREGSYEVIRYRVERRSREVDVRFASESDNWADIAGRLKGANMYGPAARCKTEFPRATNVRAASMYQVSEWSNLLRTIMGIRAHPG